MATVRNISSHPVDLTGGETLAPQAQGAANPLLDHEADLIANGLLIVVDGSTPAPPNPSVQVDTFIGGVTPDRSDYLWVETDDTGATVALHDHHGLVFSPESGSLATGHPVVAPGVLHRSSIYTPTRGVGAVRQPDTLFLLDVRDEKDVLEQGARLSADYDHYLSDIDVAPLVDGIDWRKAIGQTSGTDDCLYVPLDGLLPRDQFTVELDLKVLGQDFTAGPSQQGTFFRAATYLGAINGELFEIRRSSTDLLQAIWTNGANGGDQVTEYFTVPSGYIPADTWVKIVATWDGSKIRLWLYGAAGQNLSGVSSAIPIPNTLTTAPMSSIKRGPGGLRINGANTGHYAGANGPYVVGGVHIMRKARTPGAYVDITGPTVTIDTATALGSAPPLPQLAGMFAQYAGWRDTAPDTLPALRNKIIAAAGADGLSTSRVALTWENVTIGGTNPYTYDFTHWDDQLDALVLGGVDEFLICLTYCPTPLWQGSGNQRFNPPSSNANMAQIVSDATTHLVGRYGSKIKVISVWNEPDTAGWWTGTASAFATMWGAIQAKMATDHPSVPFGGPDGFWVDGSTGITRAVIDYAAANSRPLPMLFQHGYEGDLWELRDALRRQQAYAAAAGFGTIPVAYTEWNNDNGIYSVRQDASAPSSLANTDEVPFTQAMTSFSFAALAEMDASGVVQYATFTRLGQLDEAFYSEFEMGSGLFSNTDPPRPFPVYGVFQALWKAKGGRVTATANRPYLRALAAKDTAGVITAVFGAYRHYRPGDQADVALNFTTALPATFTWELLTAADTAEPRLKVTASGDQTNLPLGIKLGMQDVACLQITPGA